ncbi:bifunctional transcriptional activator/DNA repair enzyme AdaA [Chromobacterium alticapitis]|uniref:3-methyladenine DNA glycosylase 2 n=1 Tax=Chromobacterium alticapitis TaxID=2073169 RepID=A0A2S5DJB5_9NEIS|nr:AlkA N-terminal domain-containing protein [Chromobacterium alticapitis]POZ63119.1 3-methyladenine DNA glycosylase 2 [Chromobacterium alticapitis]
MELDPDFCHRALASRDARFDGRFFIGVRSTGIYCRPICPARTAKRENILVYPTAAAAQEAGFRPCLRCRPEAAPDSGAWRGVPNSGHSHTVARALALIEQGLLDEAGLASLTDKLGVGERQLRRLFAQHVGASPQAVAQTRRVLLAKQLIHETRLPLTDIAFAAGFGSVRRFNEVFQQLYQRPPGDLRRDADAAQAAPDHISLLLRYRPPYHWPAMLAHLRSQAAPGLETIVGEQYVRAIALDGECGVLTVSHEPRQRALRVDLRFPRLRALPRLLARVKAMFDLSADMEPIERQLAQDPLLARLIPLQTGLRLPGVWDGGEILFRRLSIPDRLAWLETRGLPLSHPAFPALRFALPESAESLTDGPDQLPSEPDWQAVLLAREGEAADLSPSRMESWRPWRAYAARHLLMATDQETRLAHAPPEYALRAAS